MSELPRKLFFDRIEERGYDYFDKTDDAKCELVEPANTLEERAKQTIAGAVVSHLKHPNIVPVRFAGPRVFRLSVPHDPGVPGMLLADDVLSILVQLADALGRVHARGATHGWLQDYNLYITGKPGAWKPQLALPGRVRKGMQGNGRLLQTEKLDPFQVDVWFLARLGMDLLEGPPATFSSLYGPEYDLSKPPLHAAPSVASKGSVLSFLRRITTEHNFTEAENMYQFAVRLSALSSRPEHRSLAGAIPTPRPCSRWRYFDAMVLVGSFDLSEHELANGGGSTHTKLELAAALHGRVCLTLAEFPTDRARLEEALKDVSKATDLDPYPPYFATKALLLAALGLYTDALLAADTALAPSTAKSALGDFGSKERARCFYIRGRIAHRHAPEDALYYYKEALALQQDPVYEQAIAAAKRAMKTV